MGLPMKREAETARELAASKKARMATGEVIISGDDTASEQDEEASMQTDRSMEEEEEEEASMQSDDESMPDRESDDEDLSSSRKTETKEENSSDDDLVPDRFIRKKIDIVRELQIFFWTTTESDARPIAEAIWRKHMPDDVQSELLDDCISGAVTHSRAKKSAEELASLFFYLYRREVAGMDFVQALKDIIAENGLDPYPLNKVLLEEAIEKHEELIWSKYLLMKRVCNIEKRGALKDNELKGLVTDHFKSNLSGLSRDYYAEYVKEKIRYAKELGIV